MSSQKLVIVFLIFLVVNIDVISSKPDDDDDGGGEDTTEDPAGGGGDDAKKDDKKQNILEFLMDDLKKDIEMRAPLVQQVLEDLTSGMDAKKRKRREVSQKPLTTEEYITWKLIDWLDEHNDKKRTKRNTQKDDIDSEIERILILERTKKDKPSKNTNPIFENSGNEPSGISGRDSFPFGDNANSGGGDDRINTDGRSDAFGGDRIPGGFPFGGDVNGGTDGIGGNVSPGSDGFEGNTNARNDFEVNSRSDRFGGDGIGGHNDNRRNDNFGGNGDNFAGDGLGGSVGFGGNYDSFGGNPRNDNFGSNSGCGMDNCNCKECTCIHGIKDENQPLNLAPPNGEEGRIDVHVENIGQAEYINMNRKKRGFFNPQDMIFDKVRGEVMTYSIPQQEEQMIIMKL